ncbi:hypothetical protein [Neotamlana laminarinivorans]|uniref:Uncharacterized protein n=1 Tax=Neotamlana laminarinivorans TaxID=2883124 RepID=A0A9X1HWU9_9FLAO|nr:hypothetical protein [Tamlana laminarinivorans]MCB4797221.1 hypothetical protein [Tamlana laminarinivorans]
MKEIKRIILFFCIVNASIAYSQNKDFNFIISVDNDLRNIYVDKFVVTDKEGNNQSVRVNYVQGNLSIKESDYKKLTSDNVTNINLNTRYVKQCGDNTETFNYDIENFKLPWLTKGNHFVLYIYDTTNKKYKKIYDPLPDKDFTFEYDWSEGSMRRVQKKLTKEQKRCNK